MRLCDEAEEKMKAARNDEIAAGQDGKKNPRYQQLDQLENLKGHTDEISKLREENTIFIKRMIDIEKRIQQS